MSSICFYLGKVNWIIIFVFFVGLKNYIEVFFMGKVLFYLSGFLILEEGKGFRFVSNEV